MKYRYLKVDRRRIITVSNRDKRIHIVTDEDVLIFLHISFRKKPKRNRR